TPGSGCCSTGSCDCRRSATCRSNGPSHCRPSRPRSPSSRTRPGGTSPASSSKPRPPRCPRLPPWSASTWGSGTSPCCRTGGRSPHPGSCGGAEKLLPRRQRDLSRKQKGSKNRDKARAKVARAHARVADARRDFHHQLSTALIRDNQVVAVEDLAVKALARTRLAKSVHDAGWA